MPTKTVTMAMLTGKSKPTSPAKAESKVVKAPKHTAELCTRALVLRDEAIAMLKQASEIEKELLDRLPHNTPVALPDGRVVTLVDQFADKNEVWCHTPCRRFKLEVQGDKK